MSVADWKVQEKLQRRRYITDAAEKLFFSRGYDNVTMDDIAKEVGLTKKSLYLYFTNKESLFFEVVLRGTRILNALVKEYVKRSKTGFESLWDIEHAYYSFARKYPEYDRACNYFYSGRFDIGNILRLKNEERVKTLNVSGDDFWKDVDMSSITNGEIVKEIVETWHEIFTVMCDAIKKGVDEGAFRRDIVPEEAAAVFTLLLESRPNMRPDLKLLLENHGISERKFAKDVGDFVRRMLIDGGDAGKGQL
jgi:TetR/AcrR family transcriptional regulator